MRTIEKVGAGIGTVAILGLSGWGFYECGKRGTPEAAASKAPAPIEAPKPAVIDKDTAAIIAQIDVISRTLAAQSVEKTAVAVEKQTATAEAKTERQTATAEARAERTEIAKAQATANAPRATETPRPAETPKVTAAVPTATEAPKATATSIPGKQSTKGFGEVNHDVELKPGECIDAPANSMVKGDVSANGLRLFDDNEKTGLLVELPDGGKVCAQWGANVSHMGENPDVQKDMVAQGVAEMKATGCTYFDDKAKGRDPKGCETVIIPTVKGKEVVSKEVR